MKSGGIEKRPRRAPKLSAKSPEYAKDFLSALFMGLRTAQIHKPQNQAFLQALTNLHQATQLLFSSTGGFSLQFVEGSAFLNSVRLKFESSAFTTVKALSEALEAQELGGIAINTAPTHESIRQLLLLFSSQSHLNTAAAKSAQRQTIEQMSIALLGVQSYADGGAFRVDRRAWAVQTYAKLLLSVREQRERALTAAECDWTRSAGRPRLRSVRLVQDLVEICQDRVDFVLRLSSNIQGAAPIELYSVNVCAMSLVLGHALGMERQSLVDLGVGALFHAICARTEADRDFQMTDVFASMARLLAESSVGRAGSLRAFTVAESLTPVNAPGLTPHLHSQIVAVVGAYQRAVTGFSNARRRRMGPIGALAALRIDPRFAPCLIDLLINVLRVYPVGTEIILDSGNHALVIGYSAQARWDRPIVSLQDKPNAQLDLMHREGGRFPDRIRATALHAGAPLQFGQEELNRALTSALPEEPPELASELLVELEEAPPTDKTTAPLTLDMDQLSEAIEALSAHEELDELELDGDLDEALSFELGALMEFDEPDKTAVDEKPDIAEDTGFTHPEVE